MSSDWMIENVRSNATKPNGICEEILYQAYGTDAYIFLLIFVVNKSTSLLRNSAIFM